jgi:hypothetical protein
MRLFMRWILWVNLVNYRWVTVNLELRCHRLPVLYASNEPETHVIAISTLKLPKTHVAACSNKVVVLIWICGLEPRRTEIAKMCLALEADHMVAAMSFLGWSYTCRARCSVKFQVFHRCLVLFCELSGIGAWGTEGELAMPSLITATTKCKGAVFTNRQQFSPSFIALLR